MSELGITEIELSRGPCFGTCPVFQITLSSTGFYAYHGQSYVEPLGERKGRFPAHLFLKLAEACRDLNVLSLSDEYEASFDDGATSVLIIRHAGGTKRVIDHRGNTGPVRFWAFAILIEYAMREAFEIEDRRTKRS